MNVEPEYADSRLVYPAMVFFALALIANTLIIMSIKKHMEREIESLKTTINAEQR